MREELQLHTHLPIRQVGCQYFTNGYCFLSQHPHVCPPHMLFFFYEPCRRGITPQLPPLNIPMCVSQESERCLTTPTLSFALRKVAMPVCHPSTCHQSLSKHVAQSSNFFLEHSLILPFPVWACLKSKMSILQ